MRRFRCCYIVLSYLVLGTMASSSCLENGNGLILYLHKYSFYSQKVMIALFEKKLPFIQRDVDITKNENYEPWFLEVNPRGEVPVLQDGMKIIPDSTRIIDYLEDIFSNGDHPRLVPQDPMTKQKMNMFRENIDSINANTVTMGTFYHPELAKNQKLPFISPVRSYMKASYEKMGDRLKKVAEENPKSRDVLLGKKEQYEKTKALVSDKESFLKLLDQVDQILTDVETELASHSGKEWWLVSHDFTIADVGLTIFLERLDLVGLSHRYWEAGVRPQLSDYFKRAQKRESYRSIVPGTMFHLQSLIGYKILGGLGVGLAIIVGTAMYCWRRKRHPFN